MRPGFYLSLANSQGLTDSVFHFIHSSLFLTYYYSCRVPQEERKPALTGLQFQVLTFKTIWRVPSFDCLRTHSSYHFVIRRRKPRGPVVHSAYPRCHSTVRCPIMFFLLLQTLLRCSDYEPGYVRQPLKGLGISVQQPLPSTVYFHKVFVFLRQAVFKCRRQVESVRHAPTYFFWQEHIELYRLPGCCHVLSTWQWRNRSYTWAGWPTWEHFSLRQASRFLSRIPIFHWSQSSTSPPCFILFHCRHEDPTTTPSSNSFASCSCTACAVPS